MLKRTIIATMLLASGCLGGCEPHFNNSLGGPVEIVPASARVYIPAPTRAAARAAVVSGIRYAPTGKFYVLSSTRVRDAGDYWQVLVLRNEAIGHQSAFIRFDVDKATGDVKCLGPLPIYGRPRQ